METNLNDIKGKSKKAKLLKSYTIKLNATRHIKLWRKALISRMLSVHSIAELYAQSKRFICLTVSKVFVQDQAAPLVWDLEEGTTCGRNF